MFIGCGCGILWPKKRRTDALDVLDEEQLSETSSSLSRVENIIVSRISGINHLDRSMTPSPEPKKAESSEGQNVHH
jgi:hypothetical protein